MISAAEFATRTGVSYMTIRDRLRKNELPGARQIRAGGARVCWVIPAALVETFEKKKPGKRPAAAPTPERIVGPGDLACDLCGELPVGDLVACDECGELMCEDCAEYHCSGGEGEK